MTRASSCGRCGAARRGAAGAALWRARGLCFVAFERAQRRRGQWRAWPGGCRGAERKGKPNQPHSRLTRHPLYSPTHPTTPASNPSRACSSCESLAHPCAPASRQPPTPCPGPPADGEVCRHLHLTGVQFHALLALHVLEVGWLGELGWWLHLRLQNRSAFCPILPPKHSNA